MTEHVPSEILTDLASVLQKIQKQVLGNRSKFDDNGKTVKDFRRIFDQDSSRMNQAIFNDASTEEICKETLSTVCTLIEILSRTGKKDAGK